MHAHSRRSFLVAAGVGMVSLRLNAQPSQNRRIGFIGNSTPALEANLVGPFREGLGKLGYVEGRNLTIEYRWAEGDYTRLPRLVTELTKLGVEVIVTAGTPAAVAVQKNAPNIALVMVAVGDPVGTGVAKDLAHPGGNSTGLSSIAPRPRRSADRATLEVRIDHQPAHRARPRHHRSTVVLVLGDELIR